MRVFLGDVAEPGYHPRVMTRSSIEVVAKIFIVALILVFIWTVIKVLAEMGLR